MTDSIELRIEKLVYGGDGLGHDAGHTVFVPFVLPEETVAIRPLERRKKFIRGRIERIITASPQRIAAPCPHFEVCGGCNYQHIPYEAQLEYKSAILRETLSRLARIAWDGPIVTHGSPPFGYRNRAQWKIGPAPAPDGANAANAAAGETAAAAAIGYFESGSQRLCPVRECPIVSPRLAETLGVLSRLLASGELPATLREAEAFADDADEKLLLNLGFERLETPSAEIAARLRAELPGIETMLIHDRRADRFDLEGPGFLNYRVGESLFRVGHLSFFQVNRFLLQKMVDVVLGDARGRLALDLFAGVGLFSLPLARRFQRVVAVESNAAAIRDLEINLQHSGTQSPNYRESAVEAFLQRWNERPDFVVLDPPRAGVSTDALSRLTKLAPETIAYLSCDPATLARDLAVLAGTAEKPGPYRIAEVHLVDIFPQTYHMEVFVRLLRRA